jgi:hypothetical protein
MRQECVTGLIGYRAWTSFDNAIWGAVRNILPVPVHVALLPLWPMWAGDAPCKLLVWCVPFSQPQPGQHQAQWG